MILDSPIISGSLTQQAGQTAEIPRYTAVSSSFLAASASFDARIDSIESTTASLSPRINALESFTASANGTYVNASGDSMSGDLIITGSLIVTDRITAQEFHTEYVSSSIVFQSGSTKFGDSGDDVHSFTGSLKVDGNVIASNLNGIFSSSAQLTSSLGDFFIISGTITQTTWDNIASKPGGIVSGSSQVVSLLPTGVVSGSSQITYSSISSIPVGIVSGAMQVTESLDVRYRLVGDDITFAELTFKPTLISGSSQLNGTTIQNLSGSFSGSFSGSYRGDGSGLTGLAAGAKFHTQSTPASTWTFVHNLSTQYPNVTVYGSNDTIILPQSITATNANTLVLEFGTPVAGYATAGIGGTIEVNGRTIKQYFTSSLSWRFEHNIGDRFVSIQTFDGSYEKIIPQTIALTDTTSSVITFPEAIAGWAVGTIGGDLPSISSSYGGYVLQVSAGAPYTASWTAVANVTASNAVNALTASHLNPISQSLIPAVSGAYDLGSVDKPFRHIYVGTGSIYLVDNAGTIVKTLTGDSIVTNDNLSSLNAFTASNFTTNTFTSSTTARLNSIETISASNIARLNALETTSGSVDTLNTTQNMRLSNLEIKTGSLATTGSNTFIGTQTITGSLYISSDLIVQGSSSLQNITASAVSIGTNIVNLNTANPAIRYAGLVIGDSGSIGSSGSFLYDSVQDEMIFVHRGANTTVTSSVVLMGPQTYDSIGSESYPTSNRIQKGTGNEHLVDSNISDNGTTIILNSNAEVTGSLKVTSTATIGTLGSPSNAVLNFASNASGGPRSITYRAATAAMSIDDTAGTALITFLNGGNVGIGTTNPGAQIEVTSTTGGTLRLKRDDGTVTTDETLGTLEFHTNDGDGAHIGSYVRGLGADLAGQNYGRFGALSFGVAKTANTDAVEAMRIDLSGNIGIGTTNPTEILHLNNSSTNGAFIRFQNTGGSGVYIGGRNNDMEIYAGGTEKMRITNSGSVGIGITNPSTPLQILKDTNTNGTTLEEANMAFTVLSAAGQSKISMGACNAGNYGYIQSMQDGTSWTNRTLALQPRGGAVGIATTTILYPNYKFQARVTSDRNLAIGYQGTDVSIEAYNDLVSANVPLRIYGNPTYLLGGNVGVGTATASYKLDVYAAAATSAIRINSDSGQNSQLRLDEAGVVKFAITYVPSDATTRMYFAGAGADLFNFKGNNVGIGTTNPTYKLQVNGTSYLGGDVTVGGYNLSQNGVNRVIFAGSIGGSETVSFTINNSSQSVMKVTCMMNHYGYINSYGCAKMSLIANGPTFDEIVISNTTSANGGSWTIARVDSTRFSVTKNAGSYGGGGYYFIEIVGNNPYY